MNLKRRSIRGFAWNHVARLLDYGLTYLLSILFARKLGASEYGVYVTMMGVASVALVISSVGLDETLNKFVSQLSSAGQESQTRFLVRRLLTMRIVAAAMLCAVLFVLRTALSDLLHNTLVADYTAVLVFYVFSQSLANFFANLYTARLKTQYVFVVNVVGKAFTVALSLLLISNEYRLNTIIVLFSVVGAVSALVYVAGSKELVLGRRESVAMRTMYGFTVVTWLNAFLALALGRSSDILLISHFFGTTAQTGYYDVAFSLTLLVDYVFTVGLVGVWLSVISSLALTDRGKLGEARAQLIKYQQFFIVPVGLLCLVYPDSVIRLLFSEEYQPAVPLFRTYLTFLLISMSIGNRENLGFLLAIGKQNIAVVSRAIIGVVNFAVNFLIIPRYGALGAITVTGACVLLSNIVEFSIASRHIGLRYDVHFALKVLGVSGIALLIVSFIPVSTLGSFLLTGALFVLLVGVGYAAVGLVDKTSIGILKSIEVPNVRR